MPRTSQPQVGNWLHRLTTGCRLCVLWVVACCVGVQGMALSADRVLGSRHLHLAAVQPASQRTTDLDGHRYAPEIFDPSVDTTLAHAELQRHDHVPWLAGVIHWLDDDSVSSNHPHATLVRSVHDLDLLMPRLVLPTDDDATSEWAMAASDRFDSHISSPIERPPRVLA